MTATTNARHRSGVSIEIDDSSMAQGLTDPTPRLMREQLIDFLKREKARRGSFRFVIRDMCKTRRIGVHYQTPKDDQVLLKIRPTGGEAGFVGVLEPRDNRAANACARLIDRAQSERSSAAHQQKRAHRSSGDAEPQSRMAAWFDSAEDVQQLLALIAERQKRFGGQIGGSGICTLIRHASGNRFTEAEQRRVRHLLVSHGYLRCERSGGTEEYYVPDTVAVGT